MPRSTSRPGRALAARLRAVLAGVAILGSPAVPRDAAVAQSALPSPATSPAATPRPDATATAGALSSATDPLLRRLVENATAIASYRAAIHAQIAFHSFPFITTQLDGHVYYERPDREAVVFDTAPILAGSLKKAYPNVPSPARWGALFVITALGDANGTSTYRLVPRKHGRVTHLDVEVDDRSATIGRYTWTYEDGGDVSFTQTYMTTDGHPVVAGQHGTVELPAYKADVTSTISNYHLDVPIDESVFADRS